VWRESEPARSLAVLRRVRPAWWGVLVMGLLTLYFAQTQSAFVVYVYNTCLLACLGAIALNLLMGTAGQASIGNAAFLAIGGFVSVWMLRAGVPFPADIVIASVIAGAAGLLAGAPAVRLHGLELALATLAAQFITLFFANQYQVHSAGSAGFSIVPLFNSAGLIGSGRDWAWLLFGIVSVTILIVSRLMRERAGRALRMIRDHDVAAPALGIPVIRYKLMIFTFSSMLIGLEGGLMAHFTGSVTVDNYTLALAIQYVAMILIGGLDSIAGSIIGAAIVIALPVIIPNIVSHLLGANQAATNGSNISVIVYGVLIIVFIIGSAGGGIIGTLKNLASSPAAKAAAGAGNGLVQRLVPILGRRA
jgi:branched-chain amino acid transport system permease protein